MQPKVARPALDLAFTSDACRCLSRRVQQAQRIARSERLNLH